MPVTASHSVWLVHLGSSLLCHLLYTWHKTSIYFILYFKYSNYILLSSKLHSNWEHLSFSSWGQRHQNRGFPLDPKKDLASRTHHLNISVHWYHQGYEQFFEFKLHMYQLSSHFSSLKNKGSRITAVPLKEVKTPSELKLSLFHFCELRCENLHTLNRNNLDF